MTTHISGTTGISRNALPFLVGQVCFFGMATAPDGFLYCDGSAISRTTYTSLFTAIGTLYGTGDGSTTFNLPDLRGEFIRGWDDGRGVDSGRVFGANQAADNAPHSHGVSDPGHAHTYPNGGISGGGAPVLSNGVGYNSSTSAALTGISIKSSGAEGRPRNIAMLACIFAGV